MKVFFLTVLMFLSCEILANENPAEFCDDNYYCTSKMRELTEEFKKGDAVFAQDSLSAFSGGCFHVSELYDSEHEHHGAFVFAKQGKDLFTQGSFFFFYDQDPFLGMNASEMKSWYDQRNANPARTEVKASQVELQHLGPGSDYHYWFRNNSANDKVIMIAKQRSDNYLGLIFCELEKK